MDLVVRSHVIAHALKTSSTKAPTTDDTSESSDTTVNKKTTGSSTILGGQGEKVAKKLLDG
jgi:hypothetical protein